MDGSQAEESYLAARKRLGSAAKKAFLAKMVREKAGDCKDADSTYGALICLDKEGQITSANYAAMARNLRALLALTNPDASTAVPGPTGEALTPVQQAAECDSLQKSWAVYRKAVDGAAYDQFKGGTEAPVSNALADQMLIRTHMKELAYIYDFILGNH